MRQSRRAFGSLLAVLGLLGLLGVMALSRHDSSRQASGTVHRARLASLARLQARSAIQQTLQHLAGAVNDPEAPLYRHLRELLGTRWERLDLSPRVAAFEPLGIAPTWGLRGNPRGGQARAAARDLEAVLHSPREPPGGGERDEWAALLTLGATGVVEDARLAVRQRVEESYELRLVRIGVPRPFDQVSFLAPLEAVTDVARANRLREEFLAMQPRLVRELRTGLERQVDPAAAPRLEAILRGMVPADAQAARTPALPQDPAWVTGFHHTRRAFLRELDLARVLEDRRGVAAAREAAVRAEATGSAGQVEAVYQLVDATSQGLMACWGYQVAARLHPRQAGAGLEPYLARLAPESLAARATFTATAEHPRIRAWLAGTARLEGVLDLRSSPRPLRLSGELQGQVMVLVGPAGVHLEDLNLAAAARRDRLVVASCGGPITLRGAVRAQLLALPASAAAPSTTARVRLDPSARLQGTLLAPFATRSSLELDGQVLADPSLRAPLPPRQALDRPDGGGYLVVLSPEPLFAAGGAR